MLVAEGVSAEHATQWLAVRTEKRLPLTGEAWVIAKREGEKAGLNPAQTVAYCCGKSRAGFMYSWWLKDQADAEAAPPRATGVAPRMSTEERNAEAKRLLGIEPGTQAPAAQQGVVVDGVEVHGA